MKKDEIKNFFDEETVKYIKRHNTNDNKSIDERFIMCMSVNNYIFTLKTLLSLLKPLNPKTLLADDPIMNHFGQIIYYEKDNKEHMVYVRIPLDFVDNMKKLEEWKDKEMNGKGFLVYAATKDASKEIKEANQKIINSLSDDFSIS